MKSCCQSWGQVESLAVYKVTPRYCQFCSGNLKENLDFLLSPASIATTVQGMPGANVSPDPYHQMFRRESLDVQPG